MFYRSKVLRFPEELAEQIKNVDIFQMDEVLQLVIQQCNKLNPEQEAMFLTLPRDPVKRAAELENLIANIRKICDLSAE